MRVERAMPITLFIDGHSFDTQTREAMSAAFVETCETLGIKDRGDRIAELVPERVIDLAMHGVHTKTALYLATMQDFKANAQ